MPSRRTTKHSRIVRFFHPSAYCAKFGFTCQLREIEIGNVAEHHWSPDGADPDLGHVFVFDDVVCQRELVVTICETLCTSV